MKHLIDLLRRKRALLLKAYLVHVGWLTSTCAFAATGAAQIGLTTSLWLTLVTVPPVLVYTASVHKACRAIDPKARTAGWMLIILFTLFLTPFESGLILPAKNLLVSRRMLQAWDKASATHSNRPGSLSARSGNERR